MMVNFDQFIFQHRYFIGAFLIIVILSGSGFLVWQKIEQNRDTRNQEVELVKQENEKLRAELSGQAQVVAGASAENSDVVGDKININTADLSELDKIPSVGPVIAQRIIDYRSQNGKFTTVDDLKKVKGIGDKTFEKIVGTVTVGN